MKLSDLAARLGVELIRAASSSAASPSADRSIADAADSADVEITGIAAPSSAGPAQLVFAENEAALAAVKGSIAAACITSRDLAAQLQDRPVLVAPHPKLAFARAAKLLTPMASDSVVHASALVQPSAKLGAAVSVGAGAVVEKDAVIGPRTQIDAGAVVGAGVRIGSDCHVYPRVVIYTGTELGERVIVHAGAVLGSDGFGYVRDSTTGEYTQFPQQGRLVIEDDVEIGANTTIDRGALEETRIGRGTKLDNLVHVGHNVLIGRNVVIAAQTGISGSSTIADGAILGGQVGIGDHAEIGPGAILGGQAGILPGKRLHGPGVVFWGTPARPVKQYLKELATLARLTRGK
jgi:UDP-3-O-[3-hydroxymyristoyl] glucosamine N-acyltransferase